MSFISKIFGDANKRTIEGYRPIVDKINELEPAFERFSFEELRAKTGEFRQRLNGDAVEPLDSLLPEAFAAVREAAKRTLGQRHFDVQLMGGINLHQGKISEMKTGEGKTLVATLPAYLNALTGQGVHPERSREGTQRASASYGVKPQQLIVFPKIDVFARGKSYGFVFEIRNPIYVDCAGAIAGEIKTSVNYVRIGYHAMVFKRLNAGGLPEKV